MLSFTQLKRQTKKRLIFISAFVLLLIACGGLSWLAPPIPATPTPGPTLVELLPQPEIATTTWTLSPTDTPTAIPSETPSPTTTLTPSPTAEPQWVLQGPGQITIPILLYHHIGVSAKNDYTYYVDPEIFDRQMNLLYQWGYKTISVELLARALNQGAELPPKPIILTFDDGSETTYSTALPIMQRYGFTGVSYIVYYYIGLRNYMDADQIRALYAAGWEIGSHSLSHRDLTARPERQMDEIVESRRMLQSRLGVPVLSFSYPFGAYNSDSLHAVHYAGYIAAMGLGNETRQSSKNLFYLYRQAVIGTDDLKTFSLLLPWQGDLNNLPPLTIVP